MRHIKFFPVILLLFSCASSPETSMGPERPANLAFVSFINYSTEDISLYMMENGRSETGIGTINRDERGLLKRVDSLIPSSKKVSFIIQAGTYKIVPKRSDGRQNADFNEYEEFYFPPSAEEYVFHLYPRHERTATASIRIQENSRNSRLPSFDIYFSDDMIRPIVDEHIHIIGEDNKAVVIERQWHNNRRLTIRPTEALPSSARYWVRIDLDARNTEGNRIKEVVEELYATGNIIGDIAPFNYASVHFDTSVPGYIRLDWSLPFGAQGSEIHIMGRDVEDLQAKTNYTFSTLDHLTYKILPYRISSNGRKEYNQIDVERPYTEIPVLAYYGVTHTIITNTADRVAFRINFNEDLLSVEPNIAFTVRNNLSDRNLGDLNAANRFTFTTNNPLQRANEDVTYSIMYGSVLQYSFTIKSPSQAEINAANDRRRIAQEQRQRNERKRAEAREREERWEEFRDDDRRFWSIGVNVGSMYGVPALIGLGAVIGGNILLLEYFDDSFTMLFLGEIGILGLGLLGALPIIYADTGLLSPAITGNFNITLAPFPYSFLELGCDALFINPNGIEGEDYLSFFPYANFLFFIGADGYENGGFFFGAGTGRMFTVIGSAERVNSPDLIHDRFTLNAIIGGKIGNNPHYLDLRAIGCFDFNDGFYFTMLCGYSFRF